MEKEQWVGEKGMGKGGQGKGSSINKPYTKG